MNETQHLANLLSERRERLDQLAFLGRRQLELIEHGDMSTLLRVLSAKQHLLTDLQTVERQLDPFRDQRPDDRQWADPAERQRCALLAEECERLLGEVFQLEQRSASGLQERRDDDARKLQGFHSAGEARRGYLEAPLTRGFGHLDLSSDA